MAPCSAPAVLKCRNSHSPRDMWCLTGPQPTAPSPSPPPWQNQSLGLMLNGCGFPLLTDFLLTYREFLPPAQTSCFSPKRNSWLEPAGRSAGNQALQSSGFPASGVALGLSWHEKPMEASGFGTTGMDSSQ